MKVPSDNEVDAVLNQCAESADSGESIYPGMSYEQGVEAALRWMRGEAGNPLEE